MKQWHAADIDLIRSIDGELPPRWQARVDRHVTACAACAARLAQLSATLTGVSRAIASEVSHAAPELSFARTRLEAAMRAPRARAPQGFMTMLGGLQRQASIASATAAVVALLWMALRTIQGIPDGPRPDASLTPGAVSSLTAAELCAGERPSRVVSVASQVSVLRGYGMLGVPRDLFELDALITPELGGTTDAANLWPQRYDSPVWNALVKDQLEQLLPKLVCAGEVTLEEAQHAIATDWIEAYRRFFHTEMPIQHRAAVSLDDDDELVFEPLEGANDGRDVVPARDVAVTRTIARRFAEPPAD